MATNCNRNQYQDTPVVLPGIRKVQFDAETAGTPTIANVAISASGSEVSYVLPVGTVRFEIRARNNAKLQLAYTVGESGTAYRTVPKGCAYYENGIDSTASLTLYFQADGVSTAEIVSWA